MSDMDGADTSLAFPGDGAVRRAASDIDAAAVVVDPALPEELRDALARPKGKLVPYAGPVPAPRKPESGAGGCAVFAVLFFFLATLGLLHGGSNGAYAMLALGGLATLSALLVRPGSTEIVAARVPVSHHRRYVQPATDIGTGHWKLWKRAVDARNRIVRADVVTTGRIDSVQVSEVLPQRLWEIAERLARLTEVRARHQEILGEVPPDDPDVAPTVARQRRAQEIAATDVARRVRELEALADLVLTADVATKKESVVLALQTLDDQHADLLAGVGDSAAEQDFAQRLSDDVAAVIEQARTAVKQANDAARTLALPGDETAGDDEDGR